MSLQLLKKNILYIGLLLLLAAHFRDAYAQQRSTPNWLTFEQLDDSLKNKPKKVFVNFVADWCTYCHEMDKVTFTDSLLIKILSEDFYPVKMNVESKDTIRFGGQQFVNKRINKRNPVHQIPLLMASRENKPFSLPAMIIFNESFEATARYFQFLSAEQLIEILKE
ncbi:hypothetical protein GCM10027429_09150 [Marivirga atlantica]|uniref:Thioredoxin family protein n=1 Tax=Marivirga atlantica TaxID=1548457 RepID=A0A937A6E3_9BACT|nr:thioredoxin family protein [Marivirga atlantica]MBL0764527.1 thioredoxin family protein [Marivirga atlantica]